MARVTLLKIGLLAHNTRKWQAKISCYLFCKSVFMFNFTNVCTFQPQSELIYPKFHELHRRVEPVHSVRRSLSPLFSCLYFIPSIRQSFLFQKFFEPALFKAAVHQSLKALKRGRGFHTMRCIEWMAFSPGVKKFLKRTKSSKTGSPNKGSPPSMDIKRNAKLMERGHDWENVVST